MKLCQDWIDQQHDTDHFYKILHFGCCLMRWWGEALQGLQHPLMHDVPVPLIKSDCFPSKLILRPDPLSHWLLQHTLSKPNVILAYGGSWKVSSLPALKQWRRPFITEDFESGCCLLKCQSLIKVLMSSKTRSSPDALTNIVNNFLNLPMTSKYYGTACVDTVSPVQPTNPKACDVCPWVISLRSRLVRKNPRKLDQFDFLQVWVDVYSIFVQPLLILVC